MKSLRHLLWVLAFILCGGMGQALAQTLPKFQHVFIVLEENTDYSAVTTTSMPYLTGLMNSQGGVGGNYFAVTHPSIGNYFELTTGQILTNTDSKTPSSFPVSVDNVVREILAAGKTWRSYAECLPSVGYTGGDFTGACSTDPTGSGTYYVRHNPEAYFTDVQNSSTQVRNLVPFSQFATDMSMGAFPAFSFIVPDGCDDAHDCPLSIADTWLKTNIDPLVQNMKKNTTGNSGNQNDLLIVVFDEDSSCGSCTNQVYLGMFSPAFSKPGYLSSTFYNHANTLRTIMQGLGLTVFPGDAATAVAMTDFFGSSAPDFSISASPSSQTVVQGNSTTYTATVSALNGFTGAVNFSVSGLPSGATGSFSPTSVSGSGNSTLTVATSTSTPTGTYKLTITGTSGSLTHSATVSLVVNPPPPPSFSISASPSSQPVTRGSSTAYTVTANSQNAFSGSVSLRVGGLPHGATGAFNPASISLSSGGTGTSKLTITATSRTKTRTYTLTITGTSGNSSANATVTLVVQ